MQYLRAISNHIFSRPLQPLTEPSRPPDSLPLSDEASEQRVRDALVPVSSGSEFGRFDESIPRIPLHSYANRLKPDRKPPSVRRLLHQSIPRSGLGMPTVSREGDLMRKAESSTTADELRLFGGNDKRDPNGVRIVPGETIGKKKRGIVSGFSPVDTLSRGTRQSGPVRARGKERPLLNSHPRSILSGPRSNHATDTPERSSKRRRIESPDEALKRNSISDDGSVDRSTTKGSPAATRSVCLSPTPDHLSSQIKRNGQCSEYRNVDKAARVPRPSPRKGNKPSGGFSSEDNDLSFTRDAAAQRRRESVISGDNVSHVSRKLPEQTSNISVEILSQPPAQDDHIAKDPRKAHTPSIVKARSPIPRESPDEIQGAVTVQPVPVSLVQPKRDRDSVPRKGSPSDIRPTAFTSHEKRNRKSKKVKSAENNLARQTFRIFFFRGGPIIRDALGTENDTLVLDFAENKLTITVADAGYVRDIPLQKVLKVLAGNTSSRKVRLELSKESQQDNKIDIELLTLEEKARFCALIHELNVSRAISIEVHERPKDWLEKAFMKSKREHRFPEHAASGLKRQFDILDVTGETHKQQVEPCKRTKLSDALRDNDGKAAAQSPTNLEFAPSKHASPSLPATNPSEISKLQPISSSSLVPNSTEGVQIPVRKHNQEPQTTARATRSMARQAPTSLICDDNGGDHDHTAQMNPDVDQKWNKKPLVYPRYGKKKAEVNALDLERLAPHEFLNDNIIGFYIRFLEDHLQRCNAEVAKRVYFFNSYFYATLTNSPRAKRSINYEGVEKWTRSIDLFNYDYIVVPINEDAHWYVAIICNLPYLEGVSERDKPSSSRPPSELREVPEIPESTRPNEEQGASHPQSPNEEMARQSLASMSLLEEQAHQAKGSKVEEEWPEREDYPDPSRAKFSESLSQPQPDSRKETESAGSPKKQRKAKKKVVPLGMKYDICQPMVITFDSLNMPRTSTISTLKEYLYAEAKTKRGIEINKALIKGMKAREIPLQPNFSDCGLYLLAYVEKFVQDPDLFIKKLLRKDMRSGEDWPPLRSGLLRSRLRKFMEQLYSEQEQLSKSKAGEIGLMVDRRPMSYLLGSSLVDAGKEKAESETSPQGNARPSTPVKSGSKELLRHQPSAQSPSPKSGTKDQDQSRAEHETLDSVVHIKPPTDSSIEPALPDTQGQSPHHEIDEVPDSQDQPKSKVETVQTSKTHPPSPGAKSKKSAGAVYIDDSDGVETTIPRRQSEKTGRVEVQIQVKGTPPGSPNTRKN
ncbi:SUMO protease ULP2 [Aspergillus lucknowensis]|uniref:Ubiquitin-like protease family profile domain-containing protein n=1 Tax=Aspergillus lucknowensis TaxID=176173 RepID=A0ABR4LFI9_9EURO